MWSTLRSKMLSAFVGLALLPISVISSLVTLGAFRFAERHACETLSADLDAVGQSIRRELRAEDFVLEELAARWTLRGEDAESVWAAERRQLVFSSLAESVLGSRFVLLSGDTQNAYVIRRTPRGFGPVLNMSTRPLAALSPMYTELRPENERRSGLHVRTEFRSTGAVLCLIRTLHGRDPRTPDVLVEEIPAIDLLERVLAPRVVRGFLRGFAAARESDAEPWKLLFDSDLARVGRLLDPARSARGEPEHFSRRGDELEVIRVDPTTGWMLGVTVSVAPVFDALRRNVIVALVLLAGVSLLVVAGIFHVTRGISATVEAFASTTSALAKGDFAQRLETRRSDEFDVIAQHVNRMAQELEMTTESRAIARTGARLVHDMKGVVSQMKLLLHNLRENLDDPEFRGESFQLMQGLIDHMESLALRLKRDDSAEAVRLENEDLGRLVSDVLDGSLLATRPGIRVVRELEEAGNVVTDRELLTVVLGNVITNAVEAMGQQGELRVHGGRADEGRTFVEIRDSGPGMSERFIEQELFQPFATTKDGGLGLGMYEARAVLTQLGGTMHVMSRKGAGTTVRIELGNPKSS